MRNKQLDTTRETQTSDSVLQHYQDDRDVIARLLAKLLVKMWLKRGTDSEKYSETL